MDDIGIGMGSDLSAPPPPTPRGPGRPPADPQKRAIADAKYASMQELLESMPVQAKEPKFGIYRAKRRSDAKREFRPLERIGLSKWKAENFSGSGDDYGTLISYLTDKYGEGRYLIEPIDAHGARINQLATWVVATQEYEDDMDDEYDDDDYDDEPRGRRRRRRRDDDDFEDDPREKRLNIADFLLASSSKDKEHTGTVVKSSNDMLGLVLMTSQNQQTAAREESIRREEIARAAQTEQRRIDEERRRETEDRQRREDQKRDDDRRAAETLRQDAMREADRRRDDENRRAIESSNKRMELMMGAATTLIPLMFAKKEDPVQTALLSSMMKKETDPVTLMLMKNILDSKNTPANPMEMVIQSMIQVQKAGSEMQTENMKQTLAINGEVTKAIVGRLLENMDKESGGGNTMDQILGIVTGAADIVGKLSPKAPEVNPQQQAILEHQRRIAIAQQQQARVAAPAAVPSAPAPAAAGQPAAATAPAVTPAFMPTDEQVAAHEAAVASNPLFGTLSALMAVQQKNFADQNEYQGLLQYAVQHMPLDMRVAVLDGSDDRVFQLALPTIQAFDHLKAWAIAPGVIPWLREFVPQLAPLIEQICGPAASQREMYVASLAKNQAAPETAPAEAPPVETAPAPVAELTPDAPPAPAEVIAGPGSTPAVEEQPMAVPPTASAAAAPSHLDDV